MGEMDEFKPCSVISVGPPLKTQIVLEDVPHYAEPVFQSMHGVVDWLRAFDDHRIIGVSVWDKPAPKAKRR